MQTQNTIDSLATPRACAMHARAMDASMQSCSMRECACLHRIITHAHRASRSARCVDDVHRDALSSRRVRDRYDVIMATIVFCDVDVTLRVPRLDAR
jgi:hypothetical protein